MSGIGEWLASIGIGQYAQRFTENAIDLSVVPDLSEQALLWRPPAEALPPVPGLAFAELKPSRDPDQVAPVAFTNSTK